MTSMSGVVFISPIGSPSPALPIEMAMSVSSWRRH
jgi:hypothetical protein